ncbi:MAG: metallophosphoesterase [Chthoniobacterales bacterium]
MSASFTRTLSPNLRKFIIKAKTQKRKASAPQPTLTGIDFIGDIHGEFEKLGQLMAKLGYKILSNGGFAHPRRHAVFLGDLISRGPQIPAVCKSVRRSVESGHATFILGNHELLALRYAVQRELPAMHLSLGLTLEKTKTRIQHSVTQFNKTSDWVGMLDWFYKQPLWFETSWVRAVHACWDSTAIELLRQTGGAYLRPADLSPYPSRRQFALRQILEGPTLRLPLAGSSSQRIRWWINAPRRWEEAIFSRSRKLPSALLPKNRRVIFPGYQAQLPPVFFGHYGFLKKAAPLAVNVACLELGITRNAPLCAYRWNGEKNIFPESFVTSS